MPNKQLLYNVTVKVSHDVANQWLQWMKDVHIPDVMATGYFLSSRISKLKYIDETDGISYSIQYLCNNISDFIAYNEIHAKGLQGKHVNKFKDQALAFRTVMEVEKEFNK